MRRLWGMTLTAGVIVAGVTVPVSPATAAVLCLDRIDSVQRPSTVVGTERADFLNNIRQNAVVSALGGDDQVLVANGVEKVTVCLNGGNDQFSQDRNTFSVNSRFSVIGGDGDDSIVGGDGVDRLYGDGGNDTIFGGEGPGNTNSFLEGGDGDDTIIGGPDRDSIRGGQGSDFIEGGAGDDIIVADPSDRKVDGGPGVDHCLGVGPGPNVKNCELFS